MFVNCQIRSSLANKRGEVNEITNTQNSKYKIAFSHGITKTLQAVIATHNYISWYETCLLHKSLPLFLFLNAFKLTSWQWNGSGIYQQQCKYTLSPHPIFQIPPFVVVICFHINFVFLFCFFILLDDVKSVLFYFAESWARCKSFPFLLFVSSNAILHQKCLCVHLSGKLHKNTVEQ